jgi:hypothetical protein
MFSKRLKKQNRPVCVFAVYGYLDFQAAFSSLPVTIKLFRYSMRIHSETS